MRPLLIFCAVVLLASAALAASICGTVTDAASGLPVDRAGVFLRTSDGQYTGDHTASGPDGAYCLDGLLAGVYTLEVRVDDHVVFYQNDILVADDTSDVPVPANLPSVRLSPPWPNPAAGAAKMRLVVGRSAPVKLSVFDSRGRLVRTWSSAALEPGNHDYQWDGLGSDGLPVPSGVYLVQVRTQDHTATRPLVLTR